MFDVDINSIIFKDKYNPKIMSEFNILSEEEIKEYQSCIFDYKKYIEDIRSLENQKRKKPETYWLMFVLWIIFPIIVFNNYRNWSEVYYVLFIIIWSYFIGWLFSKIELKDNLINIITFGKLSRVNKINFPINKKIKEIKEKEENSKNKIKNFELKIKEYYNEYLEDYFLKYLYRKRSNNAEYKEHLEVFSSMVEEVKNINDLMVVEECYLYKYNEYLLNKQIETSLKVVSNKNTNYITPLGKRIDKIVNHKTEIKKEIISPEISHQVARKVDWELINKTKNLIGSSGEQIAMAYEINYLIQNEKNELAEKVKNVSKDVGDGLGYDILSYFPDGREKYIEVKSTSKDYGQSFFMSSNELTFLSQHANQYFVYRIFSVNNDDKEPFLRVLSSEDVLTGQIIAKEYLIKI